MIDVVIFGTGSNGERAWRAAAARHDVNVVCFADNDPRKQGSRIHERPVVSPRDLEQRSWDFVVVASMYAGDIARQLSEMQVPSDAVVSPDLNTFAEAFASLPERLRARRPVTLDDGSSVVAGALPSVLLVTTRRLGCGDVADTLLQRRFEAWPAARLFNVSLEEGGRPSRVPSCVVGDSAGLSARAATLTRAMQERGFVPQAVYATAASERDLDLLEIAIAGLTTGVPVVQHFCDYEPENAGLFDARVRAMADRITVLCASSPALARELSARYERPVAVVASLPGTVAASAATARRGSGAFRAVMLGDVREPSALAAAREIWRRCRESVTGLGPLEWYADASRVQAAIDAGCDLGDDIVWRGRPDSDAVSAQLASADLGIVAAAGSDRDDSIGARCWLPPSLLAFGGAGIPTAAIAREDSETAAYVTSTGGGIVLPAGDSSAAAALLTATIADASARSRMASAALAAAVTASAAELDGEFAGRLVRLVRDTVTAAAGLRREGLVRLAGSERLISARLADVLTDRVHYACGRNLLPGWLNLDGFDESYPSGAVPADAAGRIFRLDLTGPHPLPDNFFRLGYSEDFIEHIDQPQLVSFLCEAYRTFQPGGVLRLSSPGLEGVLRRHLRGSDHSAASVLHQEAYVQWWHKHFVCFASIEKIARHIGWREVRECAYGESSVPELRLDTRPDQADLNLVVELIK